MTYDVTIAVDHATGEHTIHGGPRAGETYNTLEDALEVMGNPPITPLSSCDYGVCEWEVN